MVVVEGGGGGDTKFLNISSSWVEIRLHAELRLLTLLRSGRFMVGYKTNKCKRQKKRVSMSFNCYVRQHIETGQLPMNRKHRVHFKDNSRDTC